MLSKVKAIASVNGRIHRSLTAFTGYFPNPNPINEKTAIIREKNILIICISFTA